MTTLIIVFTGFEDNLNHVEDIIGIFIQRETTFKILSAPTKEWLLAFESKSKKSMQLKISSD